MKYLFFDPFAPFAPEMAAGAIADFQDGGEALKRLCALLDGVKTEVCTAKRCSMDTSLVCFDFANENTLCSVQSIKEICQKIDTDEKTRQKLEDITDILASAKSIDPKDARLDYKKTLSCLICSAYVIESIQTLGIESVKISKLTSPMPIEACECDDYADALYIMKSHKMLPGTANGDYPFATDEGAALLAVIGATLCPTHSGAIIKIGYGAGQKDTPDTPNLTRAVYGHEDIFDELFEFEAANLADKCELVL